MDSEKKSGGALLGLIVIIIILIVGGIYVWKTSENKPAEQNPVGTTEGNYSEENALTDQDAAAVDALDQDAQSTDASTGVDVKTVQ